MPHFESSSSMGDQTATSSTCSCSAELVKKAKQTLLLENFVKFTASEDFTMMLYDDIKEILSSADINVKSETQVYEALMKWIKHDVIGRKYHLPDLFSTVKLTLLPTEYLISVGADPLIRERMVCRNLVEDANDHHFSAMLYPHTQNDVVPHKSCAGVAFCVGGRGSEKEYLKSVECYDLRNNSWFPGKEMTTRRHHVSVVAVGKKLYAVGGSNGYCNLSSGEVFDLEENTWTPIACMSIGRRGHGLACLGGILYAIGGMAEDYSCFKVVERYNPKTDAWLTIQQMRAARGGVAVVSLGGFIYALGGNDGNTNMTSCEKYNSGLNKWSPCASMSTARAGAGVAKLNGYLYVCGGFNGDILLSSVERFDPKQNAWTTITSMSCPRCEFGCVALAGKIFAIGGADDSKYLQATEVYDPDVDEWQPAASLATGRAGAGIATMMCQVEELPTYNKSIANNRINKILDCSKCNKNLMMGS